jgi:hypothetical protein
MTADSAFNPYRKLLGIPVAEQPPHHYRLLGIELFEADPDVIEAAADRQMAHVQTYKTGKHSAQSQQLLNELATAKTCLMNPAKRTDYDARLRARLAGAAPHGAGVLMGSVPPSAVPVAVAATLPQAWPLGPTPAAQAAPAAMMPPPKVLGVPSRAPARRLHDAKTRARGLAVAAGCGLAFVAVAATLYFVWRGQRSTDGPTTAATSPDSPVAGSPPATVPPDVSPQTGSTPATPLPEQATPPPLSSAGTGSAVTPATSTPEPPPASVGGTGAAPAAATHDLFATLDLSTAIVSGEWRWFQQQSMLGCMKLADGAHSAIRLGPAAAEEFDLVIKVQPTEPTGELAVCFPTAHATGCLLLADRADDRFAGLGDLDGKGPAENETRVDGPCLDPAGAQQLLLRVRREGVGLEIDGAARLGWIGDDRRLTRPPFLKLPDDRQVYLWSSGPRVLYQATIQPPPADDPPLVDTQQ